ncbi:methyl-accepting chemotaxis protein [Litoribrevibacter albus]|uniref:Methyl-accepting chemotaxis protein n=1 Tax=Litoribrevibacter albus TaxID=1473156 RepID=A0AA37SBK6_9GAMM|nr:methyl-accepting chemotaxis protein [Litoribrevibacter albus]GLQ31548.1 methyl-accepting chemotaxis protein [Litoribrevibacter albus]
MKSLSISAKLWFIAFVAIVASFVLLATSSWENRSNLLESRQNELKHLTELAISTARFYHDQIPTLTEQDAQNQAKKAISALRYNNGIGYLWINDYSANIVMHPIKPNLDGRDLSGFKDAKGKRIFSEFARLGRTKGEGVVSYYWEKPGEREPVEKRSYVKAFTPWGWVIGTGVYIDDIDAIFYSDLLKSLGFFLVVIGVIFFVILWIRQDMNHAIKRMISSMGRMRDGDLSERLITTDRKDELGLLSRAANDIVSSFQSTFIQVQEILNKLLHEATTAERCGKQIHQSVQDQFIETDSLSTAMDEMATSVTEIAGNTQQSSNSARNVNSYVESSQQQMHLTLEKVSSLSEQIINSESVMHQLDAYTSQISSVLDVIRGISEQTNLLALNAAIEAARAGETGRGFAVVADEVRSLAKKTHDCTEEIQRTTEQLQEGSNNAVQVMKVSASLSEECLALAEETDQNLQSILQQSVDIADMNTQVASATHQQSCVTEEMSHNLTELRSLSEGLKSEAQEAAKVSEHLNDLADQLKSSISKFSS